MKADIDLYRPDLNLWQITYTILKTLSYPSRRFHLTEHGIHIIIDELPDTSEFRLMFLDDINRVEMDEERAKRGLRTNVLFIIKNGKIVYETDDVEEVLVWVMKKWREMRGLRSILRGEKR